MTPTEKLPNPYAKQRRTTTKTLEVLLPATSDTVLEENQGTMTTTTTQIKVEPMEVETPLSCDSKLISDLSDALTQPSPAPKLVVKLSLGGRGKAKTEVW